MSYQQAVDLLKVYGPARADELTMDDQELILSAKRVIEAVEAKSQALDL